MATREEREAEREARLAAREAAREQRLSEREAQRAEREAQRQSDRDDRENAREAARDAREERRGVDPEDRSNAGDDLVQFDISRSAGIARNLGAGDDEVSIRGDVASQPAIMGQQAAGPQIRVTFTSAEVGNGNPNDSSAVAPRDGGLAVRVQAEDSAGNLTGPVSRFDDEGIEFTTEDDTKFDVRDLNSGAQRGNFFDVVRLGTINGDVINESGESESYYINAGMGNDTVTGGNANDFLVGGGGNDTLTGNAGDDSFIGGLGVDTILGGEGVDTAIFNISTDGADQINLGGGNDRVTPTAPAGSQIRVTFTSAEVGNGNVNDGGSTALNQDGGLAVRLQLEDSNGNLIGDVIRTDDEGINFIRAAGSGQTFDVRDLTNGAQRGDFFDVVRLGTSGNDVIDDSSRAITYYTNGGAGDDVISGGTLRDFLVGGAGNDQLNGVAGDDSFIGGGGNDILTGGAGTDMFIYAGTVGNDTINDFVSGSDKIDLRAYGINSSNVSSATSGGVTTVSVDSNRDGTADFTITLANGATPQNTDFIF